MEEIEVEILDNGVQPPEYATEGSAGMDARAAIASTVAIPKFGRALIPTNIFVAIPPGYTIDVDSRSGLALKSGIFVLNAPGIVDSDYRNQIGVILQNMNDMDFFVEPNDRICQLVLRPYARCKWKKVQQLSDTDRKGGFGSTGVK